MASRGADTPELNQRGAALRAEAETARTRVPERFHPERAEESAGGEVRTPSLESTFVAAGAAIIEPELEQPEPDESLDVLLDEAANVVVDASELPSVEVEVDAPAKPEADESHDDVSEVHDRAQRLYSSNFWRQQSEMEQDELGNASKTGAMTLGPLAVRNQENAGSQKKKREQANRLNQLMVLLDDLNRIDNQIAANNEELEALGRYRELIEDGELDADNDEHRLLARRLGRDIEDDLEDPDTAVDDIRQRERELNEENDRLQEQREQTTQELKTDHGLTDQEIEQKMASNYGSTFQQLDIQEQDGDDGIDISDSDVVDTLDDRTSQMSIENEVEAFSFSFASLQSIEDDGERLAAEKALVDGLSEEAQRYALQDDTVSHIFEDSYFDALENGDSPTVASSDARGPRNDAPSV